MLHFIGTKGDTEPWANPCDEPGGVRVRWSSTGIGCVEADFVSRPPWRSSCSTRRFVAQRGDSTAAASSPPISPARNLRARELTGLVRTDSRVMPSSGRGGQDEGASPPAAQHQEVAEGPWMAVDLGEGRQLELDHYALW